MFRGEKITLDNLSRIQTQVDQFFNKSCRYMPRGRTLFAPQWQHIKVECIQSGFAIWGNTERDGWQTIAVRINDTVFINDSSMTIANTQGMVVMWSRR